MTRIDDIKARLDAREKTTSRYWIGKRRAALFAFDDIVYLLRLVEDYEDALRAVCWDDPCEGDELIADIRKRAEDNP